MKTIMKTAALVAMVAGCSTQVHVGVIQTGTGSHANVKENVRMENSAPINVGTPEQTQPTTPPISTPAQKQTTDKKSSKVKLVQSIILAILAAGAGAGGSYLTYDGFNNDVSLYNNMNGWRVAEGVCGLSVGIFGVVMAAAESVEAYNAVAPVDWKIGLMSSGIQGSF